MTPQTFTRLAVIAALIGAALTCTTWSPALTLTGYALMAPVVIVVYLTIKEHTNA